ncbi:hypothetical protein ACJX0J_040386, partial [Zea mays]
GIVGQRAINMIVVFIPLAYYPNDNCTALHLWQAEPWDKFLYIIALFNLWLPINRGEGILVTVNRD